MNLHGSKIREEDIEPFFQKADLLPAIIQEEGTGEVLMLAYMNRESMRKTLRSCAESN
jgi:phosphoribosyl-AMP cyclohydrolase